MAKSAKDIILHYKPEFSPRRCGRLYEDTTEFMNIGYGDVIALGGKHYLVLRDEAERKFGLEDPKFWVKRCVQLEAAESRILKLVFHETFTEEIGGVKVVSYRSERKEARILDLVKGDMRFMQGFSLPDEQGNLVRVLDVIRGKRLDVVVDAIPCAHEEFFFTHLPDVLRKFVGACESLRFLHEHGEKHGDVRSDHIWVESGTGAYRWIDFDYTFDFKANPFGLDLFGLGNILQFLVGKRIYTAPELPALGFSDAQVASLEPRDFSLLFRSRVINLQKLYPYIPDALHRVLMHFSLGADVFYETVDELLDELVPSIDTIARG